MSSLNCQGKLDFLSVEHKQKLTTYFCQPGIRVMPHELAISLGTTRPEALAVITVLETEGLLKNKLLIYHECAPEVIAGAIPFGIGFPDLPWFCPLCEEIVEDYRELSFDVMAIANDPIEFI